MKEFSAIVFLTFLFTYALGEFGFWDNFHKRAQTVHNYEYKALEYSKQLRFMKKENESLRAQIAKLTAENEHLALSRSSKKREIASIPKKDVNDLVHFDLYRWSPEKLLGVGEKALHFKKYDKSAQYYNTLIEKYPKHETVDDKVLFEAGIAAYESKQHYDWAVVHFSKLVTNYPKSKFYRGAKLWLAISHYYSGDQEKFMTTVEEFRFKYRNTREWQVLSKYYEDIAFKYKK